MSAKLVNLARVKTTTTGTGTITLGAVVPGFLTFAQAGVADGDIVSYGIVDGASSEVGRGTYNTAGPTLTRSVLGSTNSGAAINLGGNAQVYVTALSQDFNVIISDTPPSVATDSSLWWESDSGLLYIKYNDGDSSQWVLVTVPPDFSSQFLRYDAAQILTAAQQAQARSNIAAAPFDAMAYNGMQINGGMQVSQQMGYGNPVTAGYICDGWGVSYAGTVVLNGACNATTAVPGFSNFVGIGVTTAQASMGAGDYCVFFTSIEGYRVARLAWGTASAQPITIAFWTVHHRAGTYTGTVRNSGGSRSLAFSYTHNVADTPEYKTVTIPGCTDGTWDTTNGTGISLSFSQACGTTFTAPTLNTWYNTNYLAGPGQINAVASTADAFRITGVIVLPGIQAPTAQQSPLIMRPYDQELLLCKRYFYNGVPALRGMADTNTSVGRMGCPHPVTMRAAPALAVTAPLPIFDGFATSTIASIPNNFSTTTVLEFSAGYSTGGTAQGRPQAIYQGVGGNLNVDARL